MSEITIFENPEFGKIRTMVMPDGQVGFVGKDVAAVLGYANPTKACRVHVDEDDKLMSKMDTSFGTKDTLFINESGLYSLILSSKLPNARRFKHWVTAEVLPQIRKTGGYAANGVMNPEAMMAMMQRPEAVMVLCKTVVELDGKVQELMPKAEYCDEVLDSIDCMTMTQVAKELEMTVHELTRQLLDRHIIYRQSGQYMLYADYAHRGYARNRTHAYCDLFGDRRSSQYLVWTERGRKFIHKLFKTDRG